ncbi:MAG: DnaJ domain-containing protein [Methyloceanibacter sp.]|uniref:DnaJ domain-containing protein n=1 Tax=Methyloceanibacter sp. TaxID=1965321 RepID=UPI003D6CA94C
MVYFLAGCALLLLLIFGARLLTKADPKTLALTLRKAGGVALLAVAGFLAIRGALPIAIPLAAFGLALVGGGSRLGLGGVFGSSQKSPGQTSHVGTERLDMELDHDTGYMDGTCHTGRFAGRKLSSLSDREAIELYHEFEADGLKEAALMEAYLDWRIAEWRDPTEDRSAKADRGRTRAKGGMTVEEARAVLEVGPNASAEDIRQAHRRLMMKLHPDQGGSTYLAARINEAKEVLLGR